MRELKRQMKSKIFHLLALNKEKKVVLKISQDGLEIQQPEDIIKDPYVLEFLDIPQNYRYLEGELEDKLIQNLQKFLLELGKGFLLFPFIISCSTTPSDISINKSFVCSLKITLSMLARQKPSFL